MAKLIPLRDYVLIKIDPEPPSDIARPDGVKDYTPVMASVVAVGDDVNSRGVRDRVAQEEFYLLQNDRILIDNRHVGTPIPAEDDLTMIHSRLILGVVR